MGEVYLFLRCLRFLSYRRRRAEGRAQLFMEHEGRLVASSAEARVLASTQSSEHRAH